MAKDPSFDDEDLIRFYNRNLTAVEKGRVRDYFESQVFGGPAYIARQIARGVISAFEDFGRVVDEARPGLTQEQKLFIADLADSAQKRRPRFRTGGTF